MTDWHDRFAASTTLLQSASLAEALTQLASAGFHWVEIADDFGDPRYAQDRSETRRLLAQLGLQVHSLHLPIARIMIGHPQAAARRSCLRVLAAGLALAAELRAALAVLHVNSDLSRLPADLYDDSRHASVELVAVLADRAQELGIKLALENLPLEPGQPPRFGSTMQELCTAFPDPRLGFCLDTGHALMNGASLQREVQAAGTRLANVHLSDNDGQADRHWPPRQGVLDWRALQRDLDAAGYRGRLVLEILRNRSGGPLDAVLREMAAFAATAIDPTVSTD